MINYGMFHINGVKKDNGLQASGDNQNNGGWRETNGPKQFSGQYYDVTDNSKFAIANGSYNSILESPVFNLLGSTSTSLSFSQAYNFLAGGGGKIEISTDGGQTYSTTPLVTFTSGTYGTPGTDNQGHAELLLKNYTVNLSDYIGYSNLRIRFNYSGVNGSSWALDNLSTPGGALPIEYTWSGTI